MTNAPTTRETADHIGEANEKVTADHAELVRLAEAATQGPWDRMAGRGLVRAIRDDLAVPLFEPLEPYSDPLLDAPTCRVGGKVVFRANSQAARESAAIRQAVHNAAFIAAANPVTVLALLSEIAALRGERDDVCARLQIVVHDHAADIQRLRQAERQRDEAVGLLRKLTDRVKFTEGEGGRRSWSGISVEFVRAFDQARAFLANQGADQ